MAKIEIVTRDLEISNPIDAQHLYLIYTDDNGNREILRGGPSNDKPLSSEAYLKVVKQPYNNIVQEDNTKTYDWDPTNAHTRQTIYDSNEAGISSEDVSNKWNAMWQKGQEISSQHYDYKALEQNSNTVVLQMAAEVGLDDDIRAFITANSLTAPATYNELQDILQERYGSIISPVAIATKIQEYLNKMQTAEQTAPPRTDPLVLDLDGDGIELISLQNSSAFFDIDEDGLQEKVGWVSADDGLLVLDANNNGVVDNVNELFGNDEVIGTDELKTYDSNNDGIIDSQDSVFSELKIWQDLDGDGQTDAGELKALSEFNIQSFDVTNITPENQVSEGNLIISSGTYTKTDSSTATEGGDVNELLGRVIWQSKSFDSHSVKKILVHEKYDMIRYL